MRETFFKTLVDLAEHDRRIVFLTGDLGFMAVEPFTDRFPDRFFNVGVAEQNMLGMATGLAEAGFLPFTYSIVTFATMRPFEFIRNGAALQRLPVRVVGVGGGFEYGPAGSTHHGLEDVGIMRTLPEMTIVAPADAAQTATALRLTYDLPGPVYYRIGKDERRQVPGLAGRFSLGRVEQVRSGGDIAFLALGSVAPEAVAAAEALAVEGIDCQVIVVASVQPEPVDDLVAHLRNVKVAVTVEAHVVNGGLGSLVSEVVAEQQLDCRVIRCGVRERDGATGSEAWLWRNHGLSAPQLADTVRTILPVAST